MTTIRLNQDSAGAPPLTLANGTLAAILDWALPQNGWAIEYSSGHSRVYRAGAGKRLRLQIIDDSSVSGSIHSCVARGCEGASSATVLVDAFPPVSLVPNNMCTWYKSPVGTTTGPTVPRQYRLVISDRHFTMVVRDNTNDVWDLLPFGEVAPSNPEDDWATLIGVKNTTSTNVSSAPIIEGTAESSLAGAVPAETAVRWWWARDITGATKSTKGSVAASGANLGRVASMPAARAGYANRVNRERLAFHDYATSGTVQGVTAMMRRGWWPNVWAPLHNRWGSLTSEDFYTDSEYNPAAQFRIIPGPFQAFVLLEETDTWSPPAYG